MAVWQFSTTLLDRQKTLDRFGEFPATVPGFFVSWEEIGNSQLNENEALSALQPTYASICERIAPHCRQAIDYELYSMHWFEYDNDFTISYRESRVTDIRVRFDLRYPYEHFLNFVASAAADWGAIFLSEKSSLATDLNSLEREIRESSAAKYVRDPEAFIRNAAKRTPL